MWQVGWTSMHSNNWHECYYLNWEIILRGTNSWPLAWMDDTSEEPKPKTSFPTFNEESRDLMHLHLRVKVVSMYFQVRTAIVLSHVSDEITPTHKSGHERWFVTLTLYITLDLVQAVVNVAAYFVPTLEFQSFQNRIVINITATVSVDIIVDCSLAIV